MSQCFENAQTGPGGGSLKRDSPECEDSELRRSQVRIQMLLVVSCVTLGKALTPLNLCFPFCIMGRVRLSL